MRRFARTAPVLLILCVVCSASSLLYAQQPQGLQITALYADNVPLASLAAAAEQARADALTAPAVDYEVPNFMPQDTRTILGAPLLDRDPLLLPFTPNGPASMLTMFDGADNTDNPGLVTPPDTVGDVGPNHYVQMINLVTTIFNKNGTIPLGGGPFPTSAFWAGFGGLCQTNDNGDPIVLYDEAADRWIVTQFAFNSGPAAPFLQCVAVSQTGDPLGTYNRYAWDFSAFGFNDYGKFGVTSNSIGMMANMFAPPSFFFAGTWISTIDKTCVYAGSGGCVNVGANLGTGEFGFLAADYDNPGGTGGTMPNLFGTAMSNANSFDFWEIVPDFATPANTTITRIDMVPIASIDSDICNAFREQCIPHSGGGADLEALSGRLMRRLQVRDMGTHYSAVTSHTVDVDAVAPGGNGRAGIRWYEFRSTNGGTDWYLHQEGTHGPADGADRWMSSIAMNANGDIALGYMKSTASTAPSIEVVGQVAGSGGNVPLGIPGAMDVSETTCRAGVLGSDWTGRSGDYSSTNVDPTTGTFWHANEFGLFSTLRGWGTAMCEFVLPGPGVYVLDSFGGTHSGGGATPFSPAPPYFGFDVARDMELAAGGGGYVLDGFGGLHTAGGAPALVPAPPYFGFDASEDLELAAVGGYVLDAFGGVHNIGGAPVLSPPSPYFGFDAARDMELAMAGYYVVDGFGGVHAGGGAPALMPATPYFGFDILRDLELLPTGYMVLDGFGGIHAGGGAPAATAPTPYFGFDAARDMEIAGPAFYVLDAFGGVHQGDGARALAAPLPPYFGFDVTRDLEIR